MIVGIVGDLGSGKTLLMTFIGKSYQNNGSEIYANYDLKYDHNKITDVKILSQLKENKHNVVLLDELWMTADSRHAMSISNALLSGSILQSRKRFADVFYTTQHSNQVDIRIRSVTSMFFKPCIILRTPKDIPALMSISVYKKNMNGIIQPCKNFVLDVLGTHELYDTSQIIEKSTDHYLKDIAKKYIGFEGKKSELVSILVIDEDLGTDRAKMTASYILSGYKDKENRIEDEKEK